MPGMIDLGLRLAVDLQRHRLAEPELRSAIERRERKVVEFEFDRQHGTGCVSVNLPAGLAVVRDRIDLRVRENAGVERCGLLGLSVEPQAGGDAAFQCHGAGSGPTDRAGFWLRWRLATV